MHPNNYQTTEDFLYDPSFQRWVQKGVDDWGWEEWMQQAGDATQLASEARLILLALVLEQPHVSDFETDEALLSTWHKIESQQSQHRTSLIRRFPWRLATAAMICLSLGLGWLLLKQSKPQEIAEQTVIENNMTVRHNQSTTTMLVILEDGSSVLLQPGGRLSYPVPFKEHEREVYLNGEAFFEISKNPSRPFRVYANEIVTRVIGTSFRIKAYAHQPEVEVIVRTGQVNVSSQKSNSPGNLKEIALHPNESIRFVRDEAAFEKPVIAPPSQAVPIEQLQFDFQDTPVSKIIETIGLAYGMTINYPKEALKDCYLSTSLSDLPLQQKLKIICESIGGESRYELTEERITILSNGCN